MQIDIVTLKLVLCIINVLNLFILYIQYLSNKDYKGILHWIAGFGLIAISQFISLKYIFPDTITFAILSDIFILLGFSVVSIGISLFVNEKYNPKIQLSLSFLVILLLLILYYNDYIQLEKIILSISKSIICYKIVLHLFDCKIESIKKTTSFIGYLFFIYATVFLTQGISIIIKGINNNLDSPIFVVIYLFSIIVGIISTFGFTFLVNQRLIGEREKVKKNAQLIQYAVNNTSDAVYWVKRDGSFLELNNAACSILGYSYDELIKLKVPNIDPNYNHQVWPEHWEELKQKKTMTFYSSHIRKDGTVMPTEVNANYIYYNGDEINCAFVRDISERKQAEEKLIATTNHLKTILDSEPECIKLLDRELNLLEMNPAGLKMIEADNLEQVKNKQITYLILDEYKQKFVDFSQEVLAGKSGIMEFEIYGLKGAHRYMETHAVPLKNKDGMIDTLLAITRDVTERKKSEQQVNQLINDTIDKNNRLQNFAHIVSHNIRSHAANFRGLLNMLKTAENDEEKQIYFDYLEASSNKLSETIDNLNEIITIQTNNHLTFENRNLKAEVNRTVQSLQLAVIEHKLEINNRVSGNSNIPVIPAYLDSILLNLITNAIKYRNKDIDAKIEIGSTNYENHIEFYVKDNGIGIDLEKNGAKLFGMYKTFNGNEDARGIGLFITKNQVEAMGGKIEVESKLGEGTTFKILFPLSKK
jgi:PAS domain S-box-containing protein